MLQHAQRPRPHAVLIFALRAGKSDTTVLAKALQQGFEEFGLAAPEVVISRIQDLERLPSRKLATLRAMSILTRFP
jgi:hypothetical protein